MKPLRVTLLNFLTHPAFLAFPVAALLILLLPDRFSRYEVKLVNRNLLSEGTRMITYDLDLDGYSEQIRYGNEEHSSFVTINNIIRTYDQWNFKKRPQTQLNRCIIGDADKDGVCEVYALTYRNDSLFLSAIDIRKLGEFSFYERFLCTLGNPNIADIKITNSLPGMIVDLNGDHVGEVIFSIHNGLGIFPRRLYAYDVKRDHLLKSPELGSNIVGIFYISDRVTNEPPYFLITNYASANYKDTTGVMHDHAAYVIALNNQLDYLFPPIKFVGDYLNVNSFPFKRNDSILIISYIKGNRASDSKNHKLLIFDQRGNQKQQVVLPIESSLFGLNILIQPGKEDDVIYILNPSDNIYKLSKYLQPEKKLNINVIPILYQTMQDIDKDGEKEYFVQSNDYESIIIFRQDMKHPVRFKAPLKNTPLYFYPWQEKPDSPPGFMMQYDDIASFYTYTFNPLSYLLYVIHLLIYFAVLGFVLLVRRLQRKQLKRKFEAESQLSELKMLSIYNQINPHFTFNVLNTIGSVILQQKPEVGYELLMKFARMIRNLLSSSDSIFRSLKDEMDFVTDFLELQQARSAAPFRFEWQIDPKMDLTRPVPKMVLQTHAENAIKHGIIPLKNRSGKLQIVLSHEDHHLMITLTDNGVGRQFARQHPTYSTGKGIAILNQTIALLNQRNNHPIIQTIHDLHDEAGEACGTKVVILIPDNYDFGQAHKTKP